MLKTSFRIKFFLASLAIGFLISLQGCSSTSHGGSAGSGYTFGSGPNNTKPYPQKSKVNLQGVGGSSIRYENQRSGGCNNDYDVLGKHYQVWRGTDSYFEEGTASWYGPGFHGKKTSNGETYNQKGFTAAHKNLPLPAYLKVTNLNNGKKVIVRVNDRGPFVGDRIIDLSEGSARAIDMVGNGTAKVRLELINVNANGSLANAYGTPKSSVGSSGVSSYLPVYSKSSSDIALALDSLIKTSTYIQLIACNDEQRAHQIRMDIASKISYPVLVARDGNISRVLVGPLSQSQAVGALSSVKNKGFGDAFIKKF